MKKLTQLRQVSVSVGNYNVAPLDDGKADPAYADRVAAALEANGVRSSGTRWWTSKSNGTAVRLVGLDDGWAGRANPPALEPTDAFTIYMIHEPDCAAPWDADLILAGHTHGGQFLPAGVADRLGLSGRSCAETV